MKGKEILKADLDGLKQGAKVLPFKAVKG